MRAGSIISGLLLLTLWSATAMGDIYRYEDDDGVVDDLLDDLHGDWSS